MKIILATAILTAAASVAAAELPSSSRSREAIARVAPALKTALEAESLRLGDPIFIRIFKESRELEVWVEKGDRFRLFRTYSICYVSGTLGPKTREGDGQGPEGFYFVPPRHMNPYSRFHLSFDLGYPNIYDLSHGRTGGDLMVHGRCASVGCYAMADAGIEEIYALANAAFGNGQPFFRVHAFPFRMTDDRLDAHRSSEWADFWRNLKEGFDWFERTGKPPNVRVAGGRYIFNTDVRTSPGRE